MKTILTEILALAMIAGAIWGYRKTREWDMRDSGMGCMGILVCYCLEFVMVVGAVIIILVW